MYYSKFSFFVKRKSAFECVFADLVRLSALFWHFLNFFKRVAVLFQFF